MVIAAALRELENGAVAVCPSILGRAIEIAAAVNDQAARRTPPSPPLNDASVVIPLVPGATSKTVP